MACPQAPIEFDMYTELPHGIRTKFGNEKNTRFKIEEEYIWSEVGR